MAKPETKISIPDELVMNKIYIIRGVKVMMDKDLAELYAVETKRINEQVKRNIERFPTDFMFQLNNDEFEILKSQFATSSWGGTRRLPFAFSEHGVLMLSSALNSPKAIEVNVKIMRIFIKIREALIDNTELRLAFEEIKKKTDNNTKNIELVFQYLDELIEKKEKPKTTKRIGYKHYD